MFTSNDQSYLLRSLQNNQVVLFLGSGFSYEAQNQIGENFPVGNALSQKIWDFLELEGDYDGTSLKKMFEILLASNKGFEDIKTLLEKNLLAQPSGIPSFYDVLARVFWYRIYTTNIDNLLPLIYERAKGPRLKCLSFPQDEPEERDQFLDTVQAVYMHGKLPCRPDELIFSRHQYARNTLSHQPFYELFVREYSTHCTIFIGTSFEEELAWQYIEARQSRPGNVREGRPRSFIIAPNVSHTDEILLQKYNIIPIRAGIRDFLEWLSRHEHNLPDKKGLLFNTYPDLEHLARLNHYDIYKREMMEFAASFERVQSQKQTHNRSLYLLGASPTWSDIHKNLDAPRTISTEIITDIQDKLVNGESIPVFSILGYAGSGKSTILRRIAVEIKNAGFDVFFSESETLPRANTMYEALKGLNKRVALLFDNSDVALRTLPYLIAACSALEYPPVIVVAARLNEYDRLTGRYDDNVEIKEYQIPNLDRNEILAILEILERDGKLGVLAGLSQHERIRAFEFKARKQILVAMKEATLGKGFEEIIADEFDAINPREARMLCLCVALATSAGHRISKEEFVGCSSSTPAEAIQFMNRNLKGIVVFSGHQQRYLSIRHTTIAEQYIRGCTDIEFLQEAYIRLLSVLAHQIKQSSWASRVFKLYRDLINHNSIYKMFYENMDAARKIYESLRDIFHDDHQFWLQYGSLELEGGLLDLAENYLQQSYSLNDRDYYVRNALGHLAMRKGIEASTLTAAVEYCQEGKDILMDQILTVGEKNPYCYHIYGLQMYTWIKTWINKDETKKRELEELRGVLQSGVEAHPRNKKLGVLKDTVEKAWLNMSIEPGKRPPDPAYTYK